MYSLLKKTILTITIFIIIGYLIPIHIASPIENDNIQKIDAASFWYYPWGISGVHKGIDIFCKKGANVLAPISGIVIKKGYGSISGNYIYILGAKWRTYYFAHLDTILINSYQLIARGAIIGKAGNTGNALDKPTHLHYSIETIIPYPWHYKRNSNFGWEKMFYLNPIDYLNFNKQTK